MFLFQILRVDAYGQSEIRVHVPQCFAAGEIMFAAADDDRLADIFRQHPGNHFAAVLIKLPGTEMTVSICECHGILRQVYCFISSTR